MSYPPRFDIDVQDGGLALADVPSTPPLVVGVTASGSPGLFFYNDPNQAQADLGDGPATELGMKLRGGFLLLKLTASVAAVPGTVTPTRVGAKTGTVAITGAPNRDFSNARVQITEATVALGSGRFKYTLDGNTYTEKITIPSGGTYALPGSGITVTFTIGTGYDVDDYFSWNSKCAHWNTTNLNNGLTQLLASPLLIGKKIRQVAFTGIPTDATAAATNAAAVAVFMASLENVNHFARGMMDCGSIDTTANVLTNFVASFSDTRVAACYGRCEMTVSSSAPGFGLAYCSILQPVFTRAADPKTELSENLGRAKSGVLRGVKATTLSYDEEISGVFTQSNKLITLRTNRDLPGGAYVTNGLLKCPTGSDFVYWDWGRTLDRACEVLVAGLAIWTLAKLLALTDGSGFLDVRSAAQVKKSIDPLLGAAMQGPTKDGTPKHVSGQSLFIASAYNYIQLRVLMATYLMVPLISTEGGSVSVGLTTQLEAA